MRYLIIMLYIAALLIPIVDWNSQAKETVEPFKQWPIEFEGLPLTQMQITEQEKKFSQNFPGEIARFTDGSREIIIRYTERPTRMLHPSADCFRGSGYQIQPQPIRRDQNSNLWGCVTAERDGIKYRVCEQINSTAGTSWYDVSSWFWMVLLKNQQGPWLAYTVVEQLSY